MSFIDFLKDFLNAESYIFREKKIFERELFERKERSVQLLLIIFGFIVSYSWKSEKIEGLLPYLFFGFTVFIFSYYLILPSSFVEGGEFTTCARFCAIITALSLSLTLILVLIGNITEYTGGDVVLLVLMSGALFVLILRLLYV